MDEQKTIIEINGVKLEVDLRHAKRVDQLQIGSRVKCLIKSYSDFNTFPGIVIGFEPFKELPTILVAYLELGYGSEMLKFKSFNSATKDFEIVADIDNNALEVNKAEILARFDREYQKKQEEADEIARKRAFFLEHFGRYFEEYGIKSTKE